MSDGPDSDRGGGGRVTFPRVMRIGNIKANQSNLAEVVMINTLLSGH